MTGRFDIGHAMEVARDSGRAFVELGPQLLDRIMTSDDAGLTKALARILCQQGEAVRAAVRAAGGTPREAAAVAAAYLDAANLAGAERRRRAAH